MPLHQHLLTAVNYPPDNYEYERNILTGLETPKQNSKAESLINDLTYWFQTHKPNKKNTQIRNERLYFQRRIAYEILQLVLAANQSGANIESIKERTNQLWLAHSVFYSHKGEYVFTSTLAKQVFPKLFNLLHVEFSGEYPYAYPIAEAYGCIVDKLIPQCSEEQSRVDAEYANHFLKLEKVNSEQALENWITKTPGRGRFGNGAYASKTKHITWEMIQAETNKTALTKMYQVVNALKAEHEANMTNSNNNNGNNYQKLDHESSSSLNSLSG